MFGKGLDTGFRHPEGADIVLIATTSRSTLGPTQHPFPDDNAAES
jgi:hypothetical protein